jgi:hypothetical protein
MAGGCRTGRVAGRNSGSEIGVLDCGAAGWAIGAPPDPATKCARLIGLLPRRASPVAPRKNLLGADVAGNPRPVFFMYVIFIAFALGAQWIVASRQPPVQVGYTHALPPAPFPHWCSHRSLGEERT